MILVKVRLNDKYNYGLREGSTDYIASIQKQQLGRTQEGAQDHQESKDDEVHQKY
jgi:hypothetical protein